MEISIIHNSSFDFGPQNSISKNIYVPFKSFAFQSIGNNISKVLFLI